MSAAVDFLSSTIDGFVSPSTGMIRRLWLSRSPRQALLTICTAEAADFSAIPGAHRVPVTGGCAANPEQAVIGAVMETIERYCGGFDHVAVSERRRAQDERYLTHDRFPIYADHQYADPGFPFRPVERTSEIRWSRGEVLGTGEARWVPTAWVQVPFTPSAPQEIICCSTSSGMAAGVTRTQAVLNGLLELCERDAFMLAWTHRHSGPLMEPGLDVLVGIEVARAFHSLGSRASFVDLTNDLGVPVAMCVVRTPWTGRTLTTIGLSARTTMREACAKALCEAISERRRCLERLETRSVDDLGDLDLSDFPDRPLAYLRDGGAEALAFLDASDRRTDWKQSLTDDADAEARLAMVAATLGDKAGEIIVVDLATADIASMGLHVVKVIAPRLAALDADHRYPFLGAERLYRHPGTGRSLPELNPLPHPLA